jgi:hypothetical protein
MVAVDGVPTFLASIAYAPLNELDSMVCKLVQACTGLYRLVQRCTAMYTLIIFIIQIGPNHLAVFIM